MKPAENSLTTRHGAVRLTQAEGAGLPLLMLHGSGSTRKVFRHQFGGMAAEGRRVIALDLPGHGQSADAADPQATYTVEGFADVVEDVLDFLRVPRVAVLGWSLGGHVAIELLARNRRIAGAMLCGTPPVPPGLIGMLRGFLPSFDILLASKEVYSERDAERFEHLCFGSHADPSFRQAILRADGRARAIFSKSMMRGGLDQRAAVLAAAVPIAFVNGSEDPFVRLSYIDGLQVAAPFEGHAHVLAGAGHAPFWTDAEAFNALLVRFMRDVETREGLVRRANPLPNLA